MIVLILSVLGLVACRAGEGKAITAESTTSVSGLTATHTKTPRAAIQPTEVIVGVLTDLAEAISPIPFPGHKVLQTVHFAVYVEDGFRPMDVERFARTDERIHTKLSTDMATKPPKGVVLSFQQPEERPCPARGSTFFAGSGPCVTIFADEQAGRKIKQGTQ